MIPIESVYAVIEVKSSLNKTELIKSVENIKSVRSLPKHPITPQTSPTIGFIFAFTSDTSLESLLNNLVEANTNINVNEHASIICVLDKGLIAPVSKDGLQDIVIVPSERTTYSIINNPLENNLLLFYLFLMQFLNQVHISPPNLFKYANNENMLKVNYFIPKAHVPLDSYLKFGDHAIKTSTAMSIVDDLERFKIINDGKAAQELLTSYICDNVQNIRDLAETALGFRQHTINFYGKSYEFDMLMRFADIHRLIKLEKSVEEDDLVFYKAISQDLFTQYKKD